MKLKITKVCGMRNQANIADLLQLPVDWMGLIFYEKSKRNVPNSAAKEILAASEGKVKRVGVFVNEDLETVVQKIAKFKLSFVQLHGKESPDYCYDLLAKSAKTFGCGDDLQIILPFLLSGGLDEFSAAAIKSLDLPKLVGVDVNSKFETEPALKDIEMLQRFTQSLEEMTI